MLCLSELISPKLLIRNLFSWYQMFLETKVCAPRSFKVVLERSRSLRTLKRYQFQHFSISSEIDHNWTLNFYGTMVVHGHFLKDQCHWVYVPYYTPCNEVGGYTGFSVSVRLLSVFCFPDIIWIKYADNKMTLCMYDCLQWCVTDQVWVTSLLIDI
jgi:hypothetical protein